MFNLSNINNHLKVFTKLLKNKNIQVTIFTKISHCGGGGTVGKFEKNCDIHIFIRTVQSILIFTNLANLEYISRVKLKQ